MLATGLTGIKSIIVPDGFRNHSSVNYLKHAMEPITFSARVPVNYSKDFTSNQDLKETKSSFTTFYQQLLIDLETIITGEINKQRYERAHLKGARI